MSTTYIWDVISMTAYPRYAELNDVVFRVAWACSGVDETFGAATTGNVDVTYVPGTVYIPYDQLTLSLVNSWVADALGPEGIAAAQNQVDAVIEVQKNPTTVMPPLPWLAAQNQVDAPVDAPVDVQADAATVTPPLL